MVVLLFGALPAVAAAAEFTVNTTVDTETILETPCVEGHQCTLRDALGLSQDSGPDTISFAGIAAGSVIEVDEAALPIVYQQVTIDGDTAAGATPGVPAIELRPINFVGGVQFVPGLDIQGGTGAVIEGLAIGGFGEGIHIGPTEGGLPVETKVCGNYLGLDLNGDANPNEEVGIEVGGNTFEQPERLVIGSPASGCAPNYIGANGNYGIEDSGLETTIAGNFIGIGPTGDARPNGSGADSAGIHETSSATKAMIGGPDTVAGSQNLIWFNQGAGVFVEGWPRAVAIRRNSFLENEGVGIRIQNDEQREAPTVVAAKGVAGGKTEVTVKYAGPTAGEEGVEFDFYGSGACDGSGAGEGQTVLYSWALPAKSGSNEATVTLPVQPPASETTITATLTTEAGQTTVFSKCATYEAPPPEPEPEPVPTPEVKKAPDPGPSAPPAPGPEPTNGETIVVKPEEGKVKIKLPGTNKYVPLEELKEIPVGATIDATKGKVKLTSIDPDGTEQSADFFGGVFKVKQKEGANLVVLELLDTGVCPAARSRGATSLLPGTPGALLARPGAPAALLARPSKGTSGKLWGSGHGNFRTEGNQGAATVRGTIWLVEDRCNGTTFFKTRRGVVSVRDFVLHKTLSLPAGKSYVAGEG